MESSAIEDGVDQKHNTLLFAATDFWLPNKGVHSSMGIRSFICFQLSRRMVLRRQTGQAGANPAAFNKENYQKWRDSELRKQFTDYFSRSDVVDRDVVDFGCGEGELSFLMAEFGAKSITGIELSRERFAAAVEKLRGNKLPISPEFVLASSSKTVDCPDGSVDVLLCFDVLEHIMECQIVITEWHRILRPGGRVLIWWVPWGHPYGPHIESLVPIPWCHVFFPEKVLLETCARIYDMPEFMHRMWDMESNGQKKPNKWTNMKELPEVNRLSMDKFEQLCSNVGFSIQTKILRGFGSSGLAKLTHGFLHVPFLREFVTSSVAYSLRKS